LFKKNAYKNGSWDNAFISASTDSVDVTHGHPVLGIDANSETVTIPVVTKKYETGIVVPPVKKPTKHIDHKPRKRRQRRGVW
jgi:hypothetical protein